MSIRAKIFRNKMSDGKCRDIFISRQVGSVNNVTRINRILPTVKTNITIKRKETRRKTKERERERDEK